MQAQERERQRGDNVPAAFQSHWFLFAVFKFGRISFFFRTSQDERESKNIT